MPDYPPEAQSFVEAAGWGDGLCQPVAGDMSSRRYFRLAKGRETCVLMVANAPMESFVSMTHWLAALDVSVPGILAEEAHLGLVLLEDFGDTSLKKALQDGTVTWDDIGEDCLSILLAARNAIAPSLSCPSPAELVDWTCVADNHYPGISAGGLVKFRQRLSELLVDASKTPATVSLRDFHTENIMWLPNRDGHRRLGLLDYQDAFLTHPAYDLMSMLTDARIWIPKDVRERLISLYIERSGDDGRLFRNAFAAFSAQRNLRILGIFSRAGKHLKHLPRTYSYFCEALEYPVFDAVREETLAAIPSPQGAE